ncbi:MAG: glycoside hydrolase [Flavobacteriales bacterium]|nr:glycoside hydrolase [Flavobacteriales bacterium]
MITKGVSAAIDFQCEFWVQATLCEFPRSLCTFVYMFLFNRFVHLIARTALLFLATGLILLSALFLSGCASESPAATEMTSDSVRDTSSMVKGLSFVGCPKPSDSLDLIDVKRTHANFIALMPFAYGDSGSSKLTYKDVDWQWWGESQEGVRTCIELARAQDINCMIKPQVWLDHGSYTGFFMLNSEAKWLEFEKSYSDWILSYAKLAQDHGAAIFCIGTEFDEWTQLRPEYWKKLIEEVRQIYKGPLTYACNWNCVDKISFWNELDFIGIDAYFPLTAEKTPSLDSLRIAWAPLAQNFAHFSDSLSKKILFTEWGYRSVDYCADRPWEYHTDTSGNNEAQYNCYKALMETCCNKSWFAGGFMWKWFPESNRNDRHSRDEYSPQDKPAEDLLIECWKKETSNSR